MENGERVRHAIEAAEAIVALAESVLHAGQEVEEDRVEEMVRRARSFGNLRGPAQFRDAQKSLVNAAQALADAVRFERDRKRSRSRDGQKRNLLARNMALSTARLNAAMAGMHLSSPEGPPDSHQMHELTEAVAEVSEGVHETGEQVAHGMAPRHSQPAETEDDTPMPTSSAGSHLPGGGHGQGSQNRHGQQGRSHGRRPHQQRGPGNGRGPQEGGGGSGRGRPHRRRRGGGGGGGGGGFRPKP